MARMHNTSKIKQRMADVMAEEALREEEARSAEAARRARRGGMHSVREVPYHRTRVSEEEKGADVSEDGGESGRAATGSEEEKAVAVGESVRRRKKRSVSEVQDDEDEEMEDMVVPSFLSDHKTWPLFEECLHDYMQRTKQLLVVKENVVEQIR
ncbi:hypothetical protein PHYPSEUDO_007230 [Phytophthora pseudosyringae]|uniref:Uncharacterized protein n=1 Tax=Phytophthora pseudosyringae TaxID=221518 RepID=A0A8T1VJM3_9STRA|nr:hypothetical protein PHYPSEUDO_007230 [Phytophthora pseudosyringae]